MLHRGVLQVLVVLILTIINEGNCFWLTDAPIDGNQTNAIERFNNDFVEEARKRKRKNNYFKALVLGAILVKLIIFPLAVKAMAVMATISVFLSTMSLIMSSIVGYIKVAVRKPTEVKVIHVNDVWAKGDELPLIKDGVDYTSNVPLEQVHYNVKR